MTKFSFRACGRLAGCAALAMLSPATAQAQEILSTVSSELDLDGPSEGADRQVTTVAGQKVTTTYGGADSRAQTDFGVNKLYAQGNSTHKQTVNSAWLDSYTVGGAAGSTVDVSFTMTIDGMANLEPGGSVNDAPNYNFQLYALRGTGWSFVGDESASYDVLGLTRTMGDGSTRFVNSRDFSGVTSFNAGGDFLGRTFYDAASDTYFSYAPDGSYNAFGKTSMQSFFPNGQPNGPVRLYDNFPTLKTARITLDNNYLVLGWGRFCDFAENACPSVVTAGTDVTVSFRLAAGATFSLAGTMFADDIYDGTVDFFNTAKMTGVSVSDGGSLTAASGALRDLGNGKYGYQAVLDAAGAVPEPGAWALLILGFGLTGAAMRRRGARVAFA